MYFTTDGSTPTETSVRYDGTLLTINESQVLRVAVFNPEGEPIATAGGSYLIDEPASELLTVSVGIDPWRVFGTTRGWFTVNRETHAEHPAHTDLFEVDGRRVHGGTLGLRMFGGVSRGHPQKSFSLSGRERYGNKRIDYPLFGKDEPKDFRFLVVRNGGSDWARSYVRDALLTGLLQDGSWQLDHQAARPVRVYLNGKYWGLYHLREKINPRYLADHHGVDKDSVDLLEHRATAKHGSADSYRELHDFIRDHDFRDPVAYRELGTLMDIDNFQRLQIAQTYFDNRDAGGNIRYWRPQTPDGRFRWILYDVDQGFGLHRTAGWTTNTLLANTEASGPSWPNPPWSTLFQRRLLENDDYRRNFVNRSLDYLHTDFSAVAALERTEAAITAVTDEMPRQLTRWHGRMDHWRYHTELLRQYARLRPTYLREHLRDFFDAGADRPLDLAAGRGGYVVLNDNLQVGSDGLTGQYFSNYPLRLEAVAEPGYTFSGWTGLPGRQARQTLDLTENREYFIRAEFTPATHPLADRVIINEICPRSRAGGDWLELHNRSDIAIDLAGWYLVDGSSQRFTFPAIELAPGGYLAVCRDAERFAATYPEVKDFLSGLPFGLNKEGDDAGLYAADNSYVNAISYTLPLASDTAFVYALALPGLNNAHPKNWIQEAGTGTPGAANPAHLQQAIIPQQTYWARIGIGLAVLIVVALLKTLHLRPRP